MSNRNNNGNRGDSQSGSIFIQHATSQRQGTSLATPVMLCTRIIRPLSALACVCSYVKLVKIMDVCNFACIMKQNLN